MQLSKSFRNAAVLAGMTACPAVAWAYIGPGAGLSVIGSLLAFLVAIVAAVVGFVWFPIRRMIRRRKSSQAPAVRREAAQRDGVDARKPLHRGSGA